MEQELLQLKRRISREFLGRCGIHAIGICEPDRSVTVSVAGEENDEFRQLLDALRLAAHPFHVMVRREPPPRFHSNEAADDSDSRRA